ncbi:MAG: hypothetical protein H0U56_01695 [Methylibium sp.]|nr:hypothetical protein [Methylibium sp.]
MATYACTRVPAVKTSIIIDLLRVPNTLLQKVRGERGGRSLTRLAARVGAAHDLFSILPRDIAISAPPPPPDMLPTTAVWTDGSCTASKPGAVGTTGAAFVIVDTSVQPEAVRSEHSFHLGSGTNNTAELSAILLALEHFAAEPSRPLLFCSDSQYAIGACGTNRVDKNLDLIYRIRSMIQLRHPRPQFQHVEAHVGNKHNETADKLAKAACADHVDLSLRPTSASWLSHRSTAHAARPTHRVPRAPSAAASTPTPLSHRDAPVAPTAELAMLDVDAALALQRKVRHAVGLARRGHMRLAARVLERTPLPPLTPQRLAHLEKLHPPRPAPSALELPPRLAQLPTLVVEPDMVRRLVHDCNDGKAPGPSNLTFDHLQTIIKDPDCMRGVCAIVQDIINGDIEPAAAACLTACTSVAIGKPHSDGVRPLAIPETLYKLAGLHALESIKHLMPELFPSIQLGCGVKGGPEIAVHRTQLALERGGPDTVVLRTDFKNAFNERSRHAIAKALFACKSTSPLWRFFVFAYGGASHMGVYERGQLVHRFLANNGVKQGCPIASFLYALSVQSLYEACVADTPDVEAYAVADDLTLTGPCLSVLQALRKLIELTAADGPSLNLSKCSVLWPHSRHHRDFKEFADGVGELGIKICYDSIEMLGTTIGLGMKREAHCIDVATSHDHLLPALLHADMPAQLGALFARQTLHTRLGYLARVTPPIVFRRAAEIFDERVLATAATITGLPTPTADNNTQQILTFPFRLDGLGFTPLTTSSPCAWWASWANAARSVRGERKAEEVVADIASTDSAFHLRDTYSVLRGNGIDPSQPQHKHTMPSSIDDYWRFYSGAKQDVKPHLQGHLAHAITDAIYIRQPLLPLTSATDHGDDPSLQPTAHLYLTAVPTADYNNLTTHAFRASIRHRYNLPSRPDLPSKCVCNEDMTPTHFHSCKKLKRAGATRRHDGIVQLLLSFCRRAGMVARAEPQVRDSNDHRTRPDLVMITHAGNVYVDVSVCCTYATSNVGKDPCPTRERSKTRKYAASCAAEGALFIPFVVTSVGHLGSEARRVIDLIASQHHVNHLKPDRALRATITTAVCVQIQAGNAQVESAALHYLPTLRRSPPAHPSLAHHAPIPVFTHTALRRDPAPPSQLPSNQPAPAASESKLPDIADSDSKRAAPSSSPSPHSASHDHSMHDTSSLILQSDRGGAQPPTSSSSLSSHAPAHLPATPARTSAPVPSSDRTLRPRRSLGDRITDRSDSDSEPSSDAD